MPWGTFANFSFIACDTELDQEIVIKFYMDDNSSYPVQCSHDNRTVVDAETVSQGYTCTIMDFARSRDNLTCTEMTIRIWNGNGTVDPFTHIRIVAEIEDETNTETGHFDVTLMSEASASDTQPRPITDVHPSKTRIPPEALGQVATPTKETTTTFTQEMKVTPIPETTATPTQETITTPIHTRIALYGANMQMALGIVVIGLMTIVVALCMTVVILIAIVYRSCRNGSDTENGKAAGVTRKEVGTEDEKTNMIKEEEDAEENITDGDDEGDGGGGGGGGDSGGDEMA